MFLLKEFFKSFIFSGKKRVGFVLSVLPTPYYGKIMASARLRAYDVINMFSSHTEYFVELYKPWKKYDAVIFQKKFDEKALKLAKKLKGKGAKIVLDINVNYYDTTSLSVISTDSTREHNQILRFTEIVDGIITSTEHIASYAKQLFPEKKTIVSIPENIADEFFSVSKKTKGSPSNDMKLLYVGYAVKAPEILDIEEVLKQLHKTYNFSVLLICEKNPGISIPGIPIRYLPYRQKSIHQQMLGGDVFIAPRDLSKSYNLGHSFTKIGYPMAVGIPVIASQVPSYAGSPAILCENQRDWYNNLNLLLKDTEQRKTLAEKGISYCKENFSKQVITQEYLAFFNALLSPE